MQENYHSLQSINAFNVSIPNSHISRDSFSVKYVNTFVRGDGVETECKKYTE